MTRSVYLVFLLATVLSGRENPFFAVDSSGTSAVTSNTVETKPSLGSVSYTLPDQSRILKEVTFTFQNADGSIESRKLRIDRTIDWHRPISLSQGSAGSNAAIKGSSSADFGPVRIETQGKRLTISSASPVVRHFALANPNRIVVDFKDDRKYPLSEKTLDAAPYVSASVGNHGTFIRATIVLDGRYGYSFRALGNGVSIVCK